MKILATKKDKIKFIRSIIQGFILFLVVRLLVNAFFSFEVYGHYDMDALDGKGSKGFIALSYIGVDREGTDTLISTKRLEEHLEALKQNGYITLTQEDVINYYSDSQKIPSRSMFLMFEDGRRDTAIFAGPLLEKYNYIGTIFTYANKLEEGDPKFLSPRDLISLKEGTYVEWGTHGYRLAYINVFDRYGNFLGELYPDEFIELRKHMGRDYNHYLMDFIRDGNKIPVETQTQMQSRIRTDYMLMDEVYNKHIGELPGLYAIMHANTGQFGSNKNVSTVNEEMIREYFAINFNREGFSYNDKKTDIHDLTRMQPQAYWYPNHLLMRIKDDTKEDMTFVHGDLDIKKDWEILDGAAEFRKSSVIVTSEPRDRGLVRLNKDINSGNLALHARLTGNKVGSQTIYLRADRDLKEYISIRIQKNNLYISENGKELFSLDLNDHDGIIPQSIEENRLEALKDEYRIYNKNSKRLKNPTKMEAQDEVENMEVDSVEEGGEPFIPEMQIHELGDRKVDIFLRNNKLSVDIDNKEAVKDLSLSERPGGYIYLESAWGEYGYSQRNLADDVYDGVFEDLVIIDMDKEDEVIYMNKLQGRELILGKIKDRWNKIINWFIINL
ncbi:MAG: glycoside hydrolase [Peptococcales bacterium]|jgi:hypothetical protein